MINYDFNNLTIDEKIGQLIVFGFDGLEINEHAIELIRKYKIGNVILFARNIKNPSQVFALNQNLQKLALKEIGIPLLICIDQEGGMVTRIKNGATFFPGAMTISASNNVNNSYLVGKEMGIELNSLGINMNLAPSLDINNNPYNPVIGVRSFGDNPDLVSKYGLAYIRGIQENIIATAKHFPGHGNTKTDSHLDLPIINSNISELNNFELKPFRAAIDSGVKAIMTSHINFPAITEDNLPATLSYNCLSRLLKEKLNFKGIIITDCMEMKAIQNYYTTKKGTLMAIKAGADLVCISHTKHLQIEAINYLKKSLNSGGLSIDIINERVKRIIDFKFQNINLNLNKSYSDVIDIIENKKTKEYALNIVREGLTLVRGNNINTSKKTLLIASNPLSTTIADESDGSYSIIKSVNKKLKGIDTKLVQVRIDDIEINKIVSLSREYEQVVFCSYNANIYKSQLKLINSLNKTTNLYIIAMRNPYDIIFEPNIKNFICMYEYTPNSIKTLIEYLQGKINPKGVLPVKL